MSGKDDGSKIALSRRKVLGSIGAVGVASAGIGAGTMALFKDEEVFSNNKLSAGTLDLVVDWHTDVEQGFLDPADDNRVEGGTVNGENSYNYQVSDVKPGDHGILAFCPKVLTNNAYLWIGSENGVQNFENGQNEPEKQDDQDTTGDLSDEIMVTAWLSDNVRVENGELKYGDSDPDIYPHKIVGPVSLSVISLALEQGFLIEPEDTNPNDTDYYPSSPDAQTQTGPCLVLDWEVPKSVGNNIQSDSVELDFSFEAVQARHNSNPDNPFNTTTGA